MPIEKKNVPIMLKMNILFGLLKHIIIFAKMRESSTVALRGF